MWNLPTPFHGFILTRTPKFELPALLPGTAGIHDRHVDAKYCASVDGVPTQSFGSLARHYLVQLPTSRLSGQSARGRTGRSARTEECADLGRGGRDAPGVFSGRPGSLSS